MIFAYCLFGSILLCLILVTGFRLRNTVLAGSRPRGVEGTPDGSHERSENFYKPMQRLLSDSDFRYLKTRPEIPQSSIDRMRRERRQIFRKYLGFLAADFNMVTSEIRTIMIGAQVSRGDLAITLAKARLLFFCAMLAIEFRLVLHACGIDGLVIVPGRLTASLEQMRSQLELLNQNPIVSV